MAAQMQIGDGGHGVGVAPRRGAVPGRQRGRVVSAVVGFVCLGHIVGGHIVGNHVVGDDR